MTFIIIIFLMALWSMLVLGFIAVVFVCMTDWREKFEVIVSGLIIFGLILPGVYSVISAYIAFMAMTGLATI